MNTLKRQATKLAGAALFAAAMSSWAIAAPVVYDFDAFADGTALSSQYAGISFSQATVLKAGASLNESAFPPHSLDGAVFDDGGPVAITFLVPVASVGAYFTYLSGLTLSAYDVDGMLIDTSVAAYVANLADGGGDPGADPNEFLQVASAAGLISRVTMTSHAGGSSFIFDDLTVDAAVSIPEPSTIALMAGVLCAALRRRGCLRPS